MAEKVKTKEKEKSFELKFVEMIKQELLESIKDSSMFAFIEELFFNSKKVQKALEDIAIEMIQQDKEIIKTALKNKLLKDIMEK